MAYKRDREIEVDRQIGRQRDRQIRRKKAIWYKYNDRLVKKKEWIDRWANV